jgi:hypothetical protein
MLLMNDGQCNFGIVNETKNVFSRCEESLEDAQSSSNAF